MTPFWPTPDAHHTWLHSLAAFAIFIFFLAALLGWGAKLSRRLLGSVSGWSALALGSAFLSLLGEIQADCHLLGPGFRWMNGAVLLLGLGLLVTLRKEFSFKLPHWMVLGPVYLVLLRVLQGFRLHGHGDPLYYHLTGPAEFFYEGGTVARASFPQVLQSSSWEDIYLWGFQLMAGPGGSGLALIQCFSQWVHSTIGYGGAAWAIWALLKRLKLDDRLAAIGVMAALSTSGLAWSSHLAKNDWGTAFWILSGMLICLERPKNSLSAFTGAVLVGLGIIGKPVFGVALLGFSAAFFLEWLKSTKSERSLMRRYGPLFCGFLLGVGPIAFRNWFLTGNPVFPWGNPGWSAALLGPSLVEALQSTSVRPIQTGAFLVTLLQRLREWVLSSPFSVLLLLVPFSAQRARWAAAFGASLVLFSALIPPQIEFRYLGPVLLAASGLAIAAGERIGAGFKSWKTPLSLLFGAAWIWALAFSQPPHQVFLQLLPPRFEPLETQITHQSAGDLKAWVRTHLQKEERVALMGDNEVYYLVPHHYLVSNLSKELDQKLNAVRDEASLLAAFRQEGARFVISGNGLTDQRPMIRDLLTRILDGHPAAIVYQTPGGKVLDLSLL